jgi:uncharacterized protein YqeY
MYTIDDYKWNLNPRFIRIMCIDNTRMHYMSERESKMENAIMINSADDLMNDLGMNIDISKNNKGAIMKMVMPALKGKVDMKTANEVIGSMLK